MKDRNSEREKLERAIISCLISSYDSFIDYLDIPISSFKPKHREILQAMKKSWMSDVSVIASDCNTVSMDDLRDIAWEVFVPSITDFENYVEHLKEIITRENLNNQLETLLINLKWGASLDGIYEGINKLKIWGEEEIDDSSIAIELLKEISWETEVKVIKTWYTELDKLIWWFEESNVVVIGARPWVWKSMFAMNLVVNNILAWEKVALFSLEMNKKQVYRRLVSMNSWVWVRKLKEKNEWEAKERADKWVEKLLEQLKTFYCFDNVHTIDEFERKVRSLVHRYWVSVVYLDYLQLLRNPAIKNNPVEAITDMSQRIKQLALELWITVVELSQLNRDADKTLIKKASQLRGSWSIEQDADMVWMLDKDEPTDKKLKVSVQKCRDGRIWEIELLQISDIMRITDIPAKPF